MQNDTPFPSSSAAHNSDARPDGVKLFRRLPPEVCLCKTPPTTHPRELWQDNPWKTGGWHLMQIRCLIYEYALTCRLFIAPVRDPPSTGKFRNAITDGFGDVTQTFMAMLRTCKFFLTEQDQTLTLYKMNPFLFCSRDVFTAYVNATIARRCAAVRWLQFSQHIFQQGPVSTTHEIHVALLPFKGITRKGLANVAFYHVDAVHKTIPLLMTLHSELPHGCRIILLGRWHVLGGVPSWWSSLQSGKVSIQWDDSPPEEEEPGLTKEKQLRKQLYVQSVVEGFSTWQESVHQGMIRNNFLGSYHC